VGSTSSELIALTEQPDLAIRLVEPGEQMQEYHRQRCDILCARAKEFFHDDEHSRSLVFEKTGESSQIPEFIEYVYCWLAQDRLSGLILLGVNSEAGTHEEINQQENTVREHSAELAEALSAKYTQTRDYLVNHFNFKIYPMLPPVPGNESRDVFSGFQRLVGMVSDNEAGARIETHYFGPTVVFASKPQLAAELADNAAHSSESSRKIFCNEKFYLVFDHEIVRYVRTIESLHAFTSLVYLSRRMMDELGRKLNSGRGARIQAEARKEVVSWEQSLREAEEAKRARISKLSEIL
jgi:hypothetical protein